MVSCCRGHNTASIIGDPYYPMMHGDPGHENGPRRRPGESRQARELRILNATAEEVNSTLDVQQALERILVLVTDLLGLHTGWI
jgi:hypothetical protein